MQKSKNSAEKQRKTAKTGWKSWKMGAVSNGRLPFSVFVARPAWPWPRKLRPRKWKSEGIWKGRAEIDDFQWEETVSKWTFQVLLRKIIEKIEKTCNIIILMFIIAKRIMNGSSTAINTSSTSFFNNPHIERRWLAWFDYVLHVIVIIDKKSITRNDSVNIFRAAIIQISYSEIRLLKVPRGT